MTKSILFAPWDMISDMLMGSDQEYLVDTLGDPARLPLSIKPAPLCAIWDIIMWEPLPAMSTAGTPVPLNAQAASNIKPTTSSIIQHHII